MRRCLADIRFIMPTSFAFLACGALDLGEREAGDIFVGRFLAREMMRGDLGDIQEFLQRHQMIDDPTRDAVAQANLYLAFE